MTIEMPVTRPPDLMQLLTMQDPWPAFALLREHHPVFWDEVSQSWLVSRYEHLRSLLRGQSLSFEYVQEQLGTFVGDGKLLVAMEGAEHASRRRLINPFFRGAGLAQYAETIEHRARTFLDPVWAREQSATSQGEKRRGEFDLVSEFTALYPVDIIADIMALPAPDYARFRQWYAVLFACLGNFTGDPEVTRKGVQTKIEVGEYLLPLIAERRDAAGDDLISQLSRADGDGDRMTDEDIRSFLMMMLMAGGETTDHQIAMMMNTLIRHPDQLEALRADRSLMDAAIAESVRYDAIVRAIQRESLEDIELEGVTIPAGARVTLLLGAGNRDPRQFDHPEQFDIFRTDNPTAKAFGGSADHIGFGAGRHFCLGSQLARQEITIALNMILDHATDIRLANGFEPHWEGFMIRSLPSLKISYTPTPPQRS